ncbi:hypothetical protein C8J57DRAFT_169099 [Mycena rebaudengoi]|nr:hypothetical protein C8J57DRAFT_169099 [Mycena rebaudengoi]
MSTKSLVAADPTGSSSAKARASDYISPPTSIIVRAFSDGLIGAVASWEMVWNDRGSGRPRDYALWRGVAADKNFVVVGRDLHQQRLGTRRPPRNKRAGSWPYAATWLHWTPVGPAAVWNDRGSGADGYGSVWIGAGARGTKINALVPVAGYDPPSPSQVFALNTRARGSKCCVDVWLGT